MLLLTARKAGGCVRNDDYFQPENRTVPGRINNLPSGQVTQVVLSGEENKVFR